MIGLVAALKAAQGSHRYHAGFRLCKRAISRDRFPGSRQLSSTNWLEESKGAALERSEPSAAAKKAQVTTLKAIYASRKLDVLTLYSRVQQGRLFEDEYLLVPLPVDTPSLLSSPSFTDPHAQSHGKNDPNMPPPPPPRRRVLAHQRASTTQDGTTQQHQMHAPANNRYCAFFPHGALVFFNCDDKIQAECLELARPYVKGALLEPDTEEYEVEMNPNMEDYSDFAPNRLLLKELDAKSVAVIADVLAQAVALRHFEQEIDNMLEYFEKKEAEREAVKILRDSNKVLRDVMLNLGLLDHASEGSPAWQDERYYRIWTGLREEFEIEKRWRVLQTKAEFLQDNLRFAVELTHARTSERLEVAIILLITAELLISALTFAAH